MVIFNGYGVVRLGYGAGNFHCWGIEPTRIWIKVQHGPTVLAVSMDGVV